MDGSNCRWKVIHQKSAKGVYEWFRSSAMVGRKDFFSFLCSGCNSMAHPRSCSTFD